MTPVETLTAAKEAILHLRARESELLEKIAHLETKLQTMEKAEKLAFDHYHRGYISTERFEEKLAEYKASTLEDLKILEKAAALVQSNESSFGSLSDKAASGSGNPLLDCLLED